MKVGFLRPSIEKDFEFFIRNLPKLEVIEICGIAKILGVQLHKQIGIQSTETQETEKKDGEEIKVKLEMIVPMEEILEKMMDRYLELPRRRRKEINQILKDAQRGK